MLTNVKLRNVKCFNRFDLDLKNLNVLTGINGSGKSTFIQSILMSEQSANKPFLQLNGDLIEIGEYSELLHEAAEDYGASIEVTVDNTLYHWGYPENTELPNEISTSELPRLGDDADLKYFPGFRDFLYISAERWGPRNNVPLNLNTKNKNWLGKHGEYTIPVLGALSLSTYKLNQEDPRRHEKQNDELILDNIIAWMGEISPNIVIDATVIKEAASAYSSFRHSDGDINSKSYRAVNVGFGLSYALGIVTALLISPKGSLVVIENPEAHLHPQGQSKLGQLMGLAAKAGVQVVTETHSEHVINGARILVRKNILSPSEINILYFKRNDKEKKSNCEKLDVNEVGQISKWPEGFFDQQAIDMKTLMTGE